jgi:hypothetical protein
MINYAYFYAVIMLDTGLCIEVKDTTLYYDPEEYPDHIAIPEHSEVYLLKYYNQADGKWYTDAAFTVEAEGLNG